MNRSADYGHLLAVGESRMADWPSRPASANRCRWRAAGVAAFTADLGGQGPGHPARNAEPLRPQPVRAGSR